MSVRLPICPRCNTPADHFPGDARCKVPAKAPAARPAVASRFQAIQPPPAPVARPAEAPRPSPVVRLPSAPSVAGVPVRIGISYQIAGCEIRSEAPPVPGIEAPPVIADELVIQGWTMPVPKGVQ